MTALAAFLTGRLDEDEAAAKAVAPLAHVTDMGGTRLDERFSHARVRFAPEDGRSRIEPDTAAGRHFARYDPARVLREIEAKRAILAEYEAFRQEADKMRATLGEVGPGVFAATRELGDVVRMLAAVYCDHPDYRQEWS